MSGVAQWLACWAHNPKVRGSKPRSATLFVRLSSIWQTRDSGGMTCVDKVGALASQPYVRGGQINACCWGQDGMWPP